MSATLTTGIKQMENLNNTTENTAITFEQLAEKLNGKIWTKGELKRIYLDRGFNTKKMSTKTYVFQKEDGTYGVSCYIECPSQAFAWIKSQQQEVIENVMSDIEEALNPTEEVEEDNTNEVIAVAIATIEKAKVKEVLSTETPEFGVGSKVKHQRFDVGTVVAESEEKIEINFPDHGLKVMVKKFCKLELVEANGN